MGGAAGGRGKGGGWRAAQRARRSLQVVASAHFSDGSSQPLGSVPVWSHCWSRLYGGMLLRVKGRGGEEGVSGGEGMVHATGDGRQGEGRWSVEVRVSLEGGQKGAGGGELWVTGGQLSAMDPKSYAQQQDAKIRKVSEGCADTCSCSQVLLVRPLLSRFLCFLTMVASHGSSHEKVPFSVIVCL